MRDCPGNSGTVEAYETVDPCSACMHMYVYGGLLQLSASQWTGISVTLLTMALGSRLSTQFNSGCVSVYEHTCPFFD